MRPITEGKPSRRGLAYARTCLWGNGAGFFSIYRRMEGTAESSIRGASSHVAGFQPGQTVRLRSGVIGVVARCDPALCIVCVQYEAGGLLIDDLCLPDELTPIELLTCDAACQRSLPAEDPT